VKRFFGTACAFLLRSRSKFAINMGNQSGSYLEQLAMNWDQIEGKWKEIKGQAKQKWGKLTNDDLDVIDGKREELVGKVQNRYGMAKDEAEKQVKEFETSCNC
jgi:uncharacterized protein YjbJ (UPF0337 family)